MKKDTGPVPVGKGSEGKPIHEASPVLKRAITGKPKFISKNTTSPNRENEEDDSVKLASPRESRQEGRRTIITAHNK